MKKQFFGVLLIAASLCVACDTDTDPEQDNNNAEQPATPEQPATAEVGSSQQYLRAAAILNNAFNILYTTDISSQLNLVAISSDRLFMQ